MTTKYGMFLEHQYLRPGSGSPGATRRNKDEEPAPVTRDGGLNMKATVGRSGKLNDATFTKFASLHEGDKYIDPLKAKLQADAEKRKANVTDKAFKAASPMKKSACPGDFYGTSGKVVYEAETVDVQKKKGDIPEQPKGIYTSPAKKGTFGMNKFTLSERVGYKGVSTEYEYQHDPVALQEARKKAEHEAERKARVTELPFKPSNPAKKGGFGVPNTTISKGKGVAGEWEYVTAPPPDKKEGEEEKKDLAPFRPTNAHVGKRTNHIDYIHDPEAPKLKAESDRKKAESARLAASGPWRPNMSYKTDMVRSIVRMNI